MGHIAHLSNNSDNNIILINGGVINKIADQCRNIDTE